MDPGPNDGVGRGESPGGRCRGRGDGLELRDGDAGGTWDPEEPARPPQGDEAWEASGLHARGGCCAAWRR